ncbi:hypothetical protein EDD25_1032 [Cryobacterium psychrophilum]|nr:hypothetical protein EDD25_1032 [Cryobacterium psychrophilum]
MPGVPRAARESSGFRREVYCRAFLPVRVGVGEELFLGND